MKQMIANKTRPGMLSLYCPVKDKEQDWEKTYHHGEGEQRALPRSRPMSAVYLLDDVRYRVKPAVDSIRADTSMDLKAVPKDTFIASYLASASDSPDRCW